MREPGANDELLSLIIVSPVVQIKFLNSMSLNARNRIVVVKAILTLNFIHPSYSMSSVIKFQEKRAIETVKMQSLFLKYKFKYSKEFILRCLLCSQI